MIYCKEVAPELQESPLFHDDLFPDNITLTGNRDYKSHETELFSRVHEVLQAGELTEVLEDIENGGYYSNVYRSFTEAVNDLLPPEKDKYSTKDIHALKTLVKAYQKARRQDENGPICQVLSIVSGVKYDWKTLRGCCQGDWIECFYPVAEWSREALDDLETEYFNTGSEWIVDDGEFNPDEDSLLNINGCSIYCHSGSDDGIKQEIANSFGGVAADVVLYHFARWSRSAVYSEAV